LPALRPVNFLLSANWRCRSLKKKPILEPSPEIAMEFVVANSQSEINVTDEVVRAEDLQELNALQLAMVGGGLGIATLI
jgi:hypothetical protein